MLRVRVVLAVLASILAAACGSASSSSSPGGGLPGGAPGGASTSFAPGVGPAGGSTGTLTGTLMLNGTLDPGGAFSGSATFTTMLGSGVTCAAFAQLGSTGTARTNASLNVSADKLTVSGHTIAFSGGIGNYQGAGDYDGSKATAGVDLDNQKASFSAPDATTPVTMSVKSDGSGSLTFSGLLDNNGSSGKMSGSATWSCA